MKIVNCGYDYRHPHYFKINRPHGSGDYILLIVRSPAHFVFMGKKQITEGNSVVIFKKGTPQLYGGHDGAEYINDWVHFEADEEDERWLLSLGLDFDRVIQLVDVLPLSELIQSVFGEMYSDNKNATDSAHLYFRLIFTKISDLCASAARINNTELFSRLTKLRNDIYSHPQGDWSIPEIAERLSLSQSYLQHLYKSYFDKSIKRDVTLARMEYAKYLLFSTDYTVSVISELCGYQNDVHFMRVFKDEEGMTPTAYRNRAIHNKDKVDRTKNPFCL